MQPSTFFINSEILTPRLQSCQRISFQELAFGRMGKAWDRVVQRETESRTSCTRNSWLPDYLMSAKGMTKNYIISSTILLVVQVIETSLNHFMYQISFYFYIRWSMLVSREVPYDEIAQSHYWSGYWTPFK